MEALIRQLAALRAQISVLAEQVDSAILLVAGMQPEEQDEGCAHPEDQRIDLSTMGVRRWECRVCGYRFEEAM